MDGPLLEKYFQNQENEKLKDVTISLYIVASIKQGCHSVEEIISEIGKSCSLDAISIG